MRRTYLGAVVRGRSSFGVSFPDVPGVISAGDTMDELAANAREGLQMQIEGIVEDGDPVPDPTRFTLDWVREHYDNSDDPLPDEEEWVALIEVEVEVPPYPAIVHVAIDTALAQAIDRAGQNRHDFIARAAERELDRLRKSA